MGKALGKLKKNVRTVVQLCFTVVTNGYVKGFYEGRIFKGKSKMICVPGLNCYSCPGALGSCPIGAIQATLGSRNNKFSFYVFGFLMLVGAFCGRLVCGWLCPFGLVQDLLYKIPFPKKLKKLKGEKFLGMLKYLILAIFVIILPLFAVNIVGQGIPWFCKYICPSGTLGGGIPLTILNEDLRSAIGWLYSNKVIILIVTIIASVIVYRPFCRYICPLGAIYGLFNPISLYQYKMDEKKCTKCGVCTAKCKLDIEPYKTPNSSKCIRCGDCKRACPEKAISTTFSGNEDKDDGR